MNPLLELDQKYPFHVTVVGVAGGVGSMILDGAHALSVILTTLLLLIALGTKVVSSVIAFRAWRRGKTFRKRMNRREPAEDHLRFDDYLE